MYTHNIEAHLHNNRCHGKAMSIYKAGPESKDTSHVGR